MNGPSESPGAHTADTDVLVVGYGPVGQVLSILLAQHGWRVTVLERHPRPYLLPRAVAFDGQAARVLAAVGVSDRLDGFTEPSPDYVVANAQGEQLLRFPLRTAGHHGWPDSTSVHQPSLEAVLAQRAEELAELRVCRGLRAVEIVEEDGWALVTAEEHAGAGRRVFRARWVVGCDGANSFVREAIRRQRTADGAGAEAAGQDEDFGFALDWMACDVVPQRPEDFPPLNLQLADPARPRVAVSSGPGHRRWEFMRLADEDREEFATEENAWRLLAMFGATPENSTLDRYAVYTFTGRNVGRWRSGRTLLAGDAAHQMPPFAGQGMCSGFRDAAALAWRLDLVLRGTADARLLDTYEQERRAQVRYSIGMSVELGKVICLTDPAAAAARDRAMIPSADASSSARGEAGPAQDPGAPATEEGPDPAAPRPRGETLERGFLLGGGGHPAGMLAGQARLTGEKGTALADEVLGGGFVLLTLPEAGPVAPESLEYLRRVGGRQVTLFPVGAEVPAEAGVLDTDGFYRRWLESLEARAVLLRPDHYVYGTARTSGEVAALLRDMASRLTTAQAPE